jgi:hypothetical protein
VHLNVWLTSLSLAYSNGVNFRHDNITVISLEMWGTLTGMANITAISLQQWVTLIPGGKLKHPTGHVIFEEKLLFRGKRLILVVNYRLCMT